MPLLLNWTLLQYHAIRWVGIIHLTFYHQSPASFCNLLEILCFLVHSFDFCLCECTQSIPLALQLSGRATMIHRVRTVTEAVKLAASTSVTLFPVSRSSYLLYIGTLAGSIFDDDLSRPLKYTRWHRFRHNSIYIFDGHFCCYIGCRGARTLTVPIRCVSDVGV